MTNEPSEKEYAWYAFCHACKEEVTLWDEPMPHSQHHCPKCKFYVTAEEFQKTEV